jgi:hypothetical protein
MTTIRAIIAILVLAFAVTAFWYVSGLRVANVTLEAENAALARSVTSLTYQAAQSVEARRVEAARAQMWANRATQLDASIEVLLTGDIPDENLDPRIAAIVNGWDVFND